MTSSTPLTPGHAAALLLASMEALQAEAEALGPDALTWVMKGVYSFNGSLTNYDIGRKFNIKSKDLNLLMAARF